MLLPSCTISESELDWNSAIDGFIRYIDEIPSHAEKLLLKQLWQENSEGKFQVFKTAAHYCNCRGNES